MGVYFEQSLRQNNAQFLPPTFSISLQLQYLPSSLVQSFILVFSVPSFVQINDEALQLIGANCPDLITLNVHGCKVGEIGGGVEGGKG